MAAATDQTDFKKLKVQELRDELKKRDLDTTGTKPVLLARLEEATQLDNTSNAEDGPTEPAGDTEAAAASPADDLAAVNEAALAQDESHADGAAPATVPAPSGQSEAEKAKKRAERFGLPMADQSKSSTRKAASTANGSASDHVVKTVKEEDPGEKDKRVDRAKRFGMPAPAFASEELEKRKLRAKRFEIGTGTTDELKAKLDSRKERFGSAPVNGSGVGDPAANDKLANRAKRFGSGSIESPDLEAKKKARAERFASATTQP